MLCQDPPSALPAPLHRAPLASTSAAAADRRLALALRAQLEATAPHQARSCCVECSHVESEFHHRLNTFCLAGPHVRPQYTTAYFVPVFDTPSLNVSLVYRLKRFVNSGFQ